MLTSLVMREVQTKSQWGTVSHLLEWLVSIRQSITSPGEKCKLVQSLWKPGWRFLKKLRQELPYDPAIPLLGIYPKSLKTFIHKDTYSPMFIAALFTRTKCPSTDDWIKKCRTCTQWNTSQPPKRWNIAILWQHGSALKVQC